MDFEWDPAKSDATYAARGFDFAYASGIFAAGWISARRANRKERAQWQSRA